VLISTLVLLDGSSLDYEIIIVDDASPDGTQDIARELAGVYGEDKIVSAAEEPSFPPSSPSVPVHASAPVSSWYRRC
jgi:glycosyltransferase involved in cell wall biosynthesis